MKNLLKTIWHFIYPQTQSYASEYSGRVEVTQFWGKKTLDSANANYSYGLLQKVVEHGLSKVNLQEVESVLLLGMGAGCIIQSLRNKFAWKGIISAVEVDPIIIDIAEKEFGIKGSEQLQIICADAVEFVQNSKETYDLIIVDLFIDNKVLKRVFQADFYKKIDKMRARNASVIFNLGMTENDHKQAAALRTYFSQYPHKLLHKVEQFNDVLVVGGKLTGG